MRNVRQCVLRYDLRESHGGAIVNLLTARGSDAVP